MHFLLFSRPLEGLWHPVQLLMDWFSWSDIRVRSQIWFLVFKSWTFLVVSTYAVSILGGPARRPTLHIGSIDAVGVMLLEIYIAIIIVENQISYKSC